MNYRNLHINLYFFWSLKTLPAYNGFSTIWLWCFLLCFMFIHLLYNLASWVHGFIVCIRDGKFSVIISSNYLFLPRPLCLLLLGLQLHVCLTAWYCPTSLWVSVCVYVAFFLYYLNIFYCNVSIFTSLSFVASDLLLWLSLWNFLYSYCIFCLWKFYLIPFFIFFIFIFITFFFSFKILNIYNSLLEVCYF